MIQAPGVRPSRPVSHDHPSRSPAPGADGAHGSPGAGPLVDPGRWPDVAVVPRARISAVIARLLFARIAGRMPLRVVLPSGESFGGGGSGAPQLRLHRPQDFYRRVGAGGLIGFGESFMAGDWDSDDLTELLTIMAGQIDRLVPPKLQWLRNAYVRHQPADEEADEINARRNIQRHYDLSNEMFELFLDETMTYSAALFDQDGSGVPMTVTGRPDCVASCLKAAQQRKIDRLLDLTGVGPGSRVLEIGTGWGELALRAAARGAQVLTVTLSAEQRTLAARRIADAGLAGQVAVELLDYRQVQGKFDAIVSVEMIEAVSERYWPDYFSALGRLLAPGGRVGLQSITMPHPRMRATRRTQTWVLKYIFPGGLIPSVTAIEENAAAHAGLTVADRRDFGEHYAQTLRLWRERFCASAAGLQQLGFDEVFRRMWLLYLTYSEAGFRSGYLSVSQFLLTDDSRLRQARGPGTRSPRQRGRER